MNESNSNEIAVQQDTSISKSQSQSMDMAQQLFQSLQSSDGTALSADEMGKRLDIQLTLLDRLREEEFRTAKNAAKAAMPTITKRGAIEVKGSIRSRFSKLEDIQEICDPILRQFGLSIDFDVGCTDQGRAICVPVVTHTNGFVERGVAFHLPPDNSGSKSPVQAVMSSISQAKRHQYIATWNLRQIGSDDDGQGLMKRVAPPAGFDAEGIRAEGEKQALGGIDSYLNWYKSQSNMVRGWLVDEGHHADFKAKASS